MGKQPSSTRSCKILLNYALGGALVWTLVIFALGLIIWQEHGDKIIGFFFLLWLTGLAAVSLSFSHFKKQLLGSGVSVTDMETLRPRFENILSAAGEGILGLDRDYLHNFVNPAAERMLGYTQAELLGVPSHQSWHAFKAEAEAYPLVQCPICQAILAGTEVKNFRDQFMRKDGSFFPVELSVAPIIEEGVVQGTVVIFQDISQRLAVVAHAQKLQEQLFQAQKMESIATLAGGVAHDFNNLLTVINSFSETLIDECGDDSLIHQDLLEINEAGRRAADLTRQLLAFSRRQIIQPKELCLRKLIKNLMKMLRRLLREDIDLKFDLPETAVRVKADPGQFEQVIINLLVNARDSLHQNEVAAKSKKITLRLSEIELDDDFVATHEGSRPGRQALIEISDNGCGMNREDQKHCFEPFYTTKELGQGTGLGLSTVYGIVKQNDAFITLNSEPGQGTTIRIYWPLCQAEGAVVESEIKAPRKDFSPVKRATILLVENDEKIREIVGSCLAKAGFQMIIAADGQEALNQMEVGGEAPDLLFTDMVMPGMGGDELSRQLKECYPGLLVLYSSGYTDNSDTKKLDEGEAFLRKPYTIKALLAAISRLLEID